jgi:hypothetical protein
MILYLVMGNYSIKKNGRWFHGEMKLQSSFMGIY